MFRNRVKKPLKDGGNWRRRRGCGRCRGTAKVPVTVTVTAEDFVENYICESLTAALNLNKEAACHVPRRIPDMAQIRGFARQAVMPAQVPPIGTRGTMPSRKICPAI